MNVCLLVARLALAAAVIGLPAAAAAQTAASSGQIVGQVVDVSDGADRRRQRQRPQPGNEPRAHDHDRRARAVRGAAAAAGHLPGVGHRAWSRAGDAGGRREPRRDDAGQLHHARRGPDRGCRGREPHRARAAGTARQVGADAAAAAEPAGERTAHPDVVPAHAGHADRAGVRRLLGVGPEGDDDQHQPGRRRHDQHALVRARRDLAVGRPRSAEGDAGAPQHLLGGVRTLHRAASSTCRRARARTSVRGTAFYLFRNDEPDGARSARPRTDRREQQFGGSFGGPVRQDRTFFFVAPEFQRNTKPVRDALLGARHARTSAAPPARRHCSRSRRKPSRRR